MSFPARCLIGVLVLLPAVGCGGPKGVQLEGAVTFEGKAADGGTISFEPADGKGPAIGAPLLLGRYTTTVPTTALRGPLIVRIEAQHKTGRQLPAPPPAQRGMTIEEIILAAPRYNVQSDLKVTPKPGVKNEFDFDLKLR